jgi:hypothetical protein
LQQLVRGLPQLILLPLPTLHRGAVPL